MASSERERLRRGIGSSSDNYRGRRDRDASYLKLFWKYGKAMGNKGDTLLTDGESLYCYRIAPETDEPAAPEAASESRFAEGGRCC